MPKIIQWDTIPHNEHRYETVGDWMFTSPDMLRTFSSKLSDPLREMLINYHETTEALICQALGVGEADVTAFDMAYEECRERGLPAACGCAIQDEPGDDPHAPYFKAHQVATTAERAMADALGVDWDSYNDEVESLG